MENDKNELVYKPNDSIKIFYVALILTILAGLVFGLLDIMDVGSFKRQNALGGAIVILCFSVLIFGFIFFADVEIKLNSTHLEVRRNFLFKKRLVYSLSDVKSTSVGLLSKTIIIRLTDTILIICYAHDRLTTEPELTEDLKHYHGDYLEMMRIKKLIDTKKFYF